MTTPNEELIVKLRTSFGDLDCPNTYEFAMHKAADALQSQAERIKVLEAACDKYSEAEILLNSDMAKQIGTLRAQLAEIEKTEPVAYLYEMATTMLTPGNYSGWALKLEYQKPCVPEGAVRNLQELFTRPMPADVTELVELLEFMWRDVPMNEYAFEKLEAALSKYKGAK